MISIPVSYGELVDKITILEIKQKYIENEDKLINIRKELDLLCKIYQNSVNTSQVSLLKRDLYIVNKALWGFEDQTRNLETDAYFYSNSVSSYNTNKIRLAQNIHKYNDKRAQIKKEINKITNSEIVEEKSYE